MSEHVELKVAVVGSEVMLHFGGKGDWLALSADDAERFGKLLQDSAAVARKKPPEN